MRDPERLQDPAPGPCDLPGVARGAIRGLTQPAPVTGTSHDHAGRMGHLQGDREAASSDGYGWSVAGNRLDGIADAHLMQRALFGIAPGCAAPVGQGPVIIACPDPDHTPSRHLVTEPGPRSLAVCDTLEERAVSFGFSS